MPAKKTAPKKTVKKSVKAKAVKAAKPITQTEKSRLHKDLSHPHNLPITMTIVGTMIIVSLFVIAATFLG